MIAPPTAPAGVRPVAVAPPAEVAAIRSLYLHVPFCERKCAYCDFTSVAGLRGQHEYVEALRWELRTLAAALPGCTLDTVFVGGGTPSLIEPALLAAVLDEVRGGFRLAPGAEVTMEANPSSVSRARAEAWLEAGVNRVSLGVQSLEPDILGFLDRVHDRERALEAVAEVRAAGVRRISCDLIYAVPGLDDRRWTATVERVLATGVDHLSCYELTVEEGTPLHRGVASGRVATVDAETALRQHWIAVDLAEAAGLRQYEVSNLARPGQESRHNLAYWANAHYLAAGVGAHGHLPAGAAAALGIASASPGERVRYWHGRAVRGYVGAAAAGLLPVAGSEVVTPADAEAERVMVGLRLTEGVPLAGEGVLAEARALRAAGLLEVEGTRVWATRRGQEVLNAVALRLVGALPTAPPPG